MWWQEGCDCVFYGLVGKLGIIESKENQTDIYKNPRLYSMNYLKSISDLAQEVTWSPEGSNGSPITSAIQNSNEQSNKKYTAQNHHPAAPGKGLFDLSRLPLFLAFRPCLQPSEFTVWTSFKGWILTPPYVSVHVDQSCGQLLHVWWVRCATTNK